jgi:hypothetical protein
LERNHPPNSRGGKKWRGFGKWKKLIFITAPAMEARAAVSGVRAIVSDGLIPVTIASDRDKTRHVRPIHYDTCVAFGVIWYNDGLSAVIDSVQSLTNSTLGTAVRTQIERRQKKVDSSRTLHHKSGTAKRIIKAKKKEITKRLVHEPPEYRHTDFKSPQKKRKIDTPSRSSKRVRKNLNFE